MTSFASPNPNRRAFLRFLAGSSYVAALGEIRAKGRQRSRRLSPIRKRPSTSWILRKPPAARSCRSRWAHLASGVDDDATLRANREGFKRVQLRPRRLRDATKVDVQSGLFGMLYR